MTSFIEQIKNIAIIDTDTGLMKVPEASMSQLDEIITEAKKMAQKPKKAPNAFIIFKS